MTPGIISPLSRKLLGVFRKQRGMVRQFEARPDDPCVLVGDSDRCAVEFEIAQFVSSKIPICLVPNRRATWPLASNDQTKWMTIPARIERAAGYSCDA